MSETYELAKKFYTELRNDRYTIADYPCNNIAIEKYIGILWLLFYHKFWKNTIMLDAFPYYYPAHQDFYEANDSKRKIPLISGGCHYTREDVDNDESMLHELLEELFNNSRTWVMDYFLGDLDALYDNYRIIKDKSGKEIAVFDKNYENYDNDEHVMKVFKLRSIKEILADCYIKADFFAETDLSHDDMSSFENDFRSLFNPHSDEYFAKYIMFKSTLIPAFLRLKKDVLAQEDQNLYVFIHSVISGLKKGCGNGWCLNYISQNLSAAYFIYDMSTDYGYYNAYCQGLILFYPDFFLAPYLIDEGIKILDKIYHFLGGIHENR